MFSVRDSSPVDLNPILDEGSHVTSGGLNAAVRLCEIVGIPLRLDPPPYFYHRGWGDKALGVGEVQPGRGAVLIGVGTWAMTHGHANLRRCANFPWEFRLGPCCITARNAVTRVQK